MSLIKGRQYRLPVSEDDFHKLAKILFDIYIEQLCLVKNNNKIVFSIGLVEISFVQILIQALHNELKYMRESQCLSTDLSRIKKLKEAAKYYDRIDKISKTKRYIRRFIKYFYFNNINSACLKLTKRDKIVCLGSSSKLRVDFINKEGFCCDYLDWEDLISKRNNDYNIYSEVALFEKNIINPFLNKFVNQDLQIGRLLDKDKVRKYWKQRVSKALYYYHNFNNKGIDKLLVTEAAKPIHKLVIRAFEDAGVKTFLFHHGNDTALTIQNIAHAHNISHGRNIVVPTLKTASQYNKVYGDSLLDSVSELNYYNVYNNEKSHIRKIKKNVIPDKPVVMLMGYPYNDRRYTDERGMYFVIRALLENKILDYLKTINVTPLYKVHPDRIEEASDILREHSDTFIYGKFEDSYNIADIIIFTYVSTTTFGYALKTDKKIVLIEDVNNEKDEDQWEMLRRRVSTIDAGINEYGEYNFDLEELKDSIFSKINQIDHSYSNYYL
jgi:hypothetical protein